MRVYRSISLSIAFVVVAFVGVSVEGSLMSARSNLQTVVAALTMSASTLPSWAR